MESRRQRKGAGRRTENLGAAAYSAVLSLVVLAGSGAIGAALMAPWLFPSLGPTLMLIFGSPEHPTARPINAVVGHAVGMAAGVGSLFLFGMAGKPSAPSAGLSVGYVAAGAVSVAVTALLLQLLQLQHPPAGATTLIISLGIIATPPGLLSMAAALGLTIVAGWGINWALRRRTAS